MMAKYDRAWAAKINGNAYRDFLVKHPDMAKITLTREQMEAIIRDLCDYTDRDAEATAWAEQATRSAARIAALEAELRIARGMAVVQKVIASQNASLASPDGTCGAMGANKGNEAGDVYGQRTDALNAQNGQWGGDGMTAIDTGALVRREKS